MKGVFYPAEIDVGAKIMSGGTNMPVSGDLRLQGSFCMFERDYFLYVFTDMYCNQ